MIRLDLIRKHAARRPDAIAVTDGRTTLSWRQFANNVEAAARGIAARRDPAKIRRLAFIAADRSELVVIMAAAATLAIPVTGLDPDLPPETLASALKLLGVDLIAIDSHTKPDVGCISVECGLKPVVVDFSGKTGQDYSELLLAGRSTNASISAVPRSFEAISFTSGTSGTPKATIRLASFDQRRFAYFTIRYGFDANDRHLSAIPLFHAAGHGWPRLFLSLGAGIRLAPGASAKDLVQIIFDEEITSAVIPPATIGAMVPHVKERPQIGKRQPQCGDARNLVKHSEAQKAGLRFLLAGGKHFPVRDKLAALDAFPGALNEYYGTTETGVNTIADAALLAAHPESCGLAFEGNRLLIVDALGQPLPDGERGQIAVASYMNMEGYLDCPHRCVSYGGTPYIITNDSGYLVDGRLYLVNRRHDLSRFNQYGFENELLHLPCLREAAVIAEPGSGTVVTDIGLVLRPGNPMSPALINSISEIAVKYGATVRHIKELSAIPYGRTGKINAKALAALMA